MQVHVLGVGAIGSLLAGHLRSLLATREMADAARLKKFVRMPALPRLSVPYDVGRFLPRAEASGVTLHLRDRPRAGAAGKPALGSAVVVERDGARMHTTGYTVELMSVAAREPVRVLVPDAQGGVRETHTYDSTAPIECLVVATKADSTLAALQRFVPRLTPASTLVLVQNGMGVLDALLARYWRDPRARPNIVLASATHGCYLKRPLHTVHAAFGAIHFGVLPGAGAGAAGVERALRADDGAPVSLDVAAIPDQPETRTLRATVALLLALPLDVHWEPIRQFQLRALRKLIINACINPTTALVDCRNGALFGQTSATELFGALCTEASQVLEARARDARAHAATRDADVARLTSLPLQDLLTQADADGLPLLDASLRPASMLREVENVIQSTAPNWSSMHQDVQGRRASTEIDYINGYLSELGRTYGIPTPVNDTLTALVKMKTQRLTGTLAMPP
ncbi:hypothetical protein MOBT1_001808 [Malassezia obtusa]|uniref:2-dehydropantoate 2-reductase n=1 Tax=Malassezia obtusa TaxID=76774 RepID=A0AAF0E208_9BASI|nr:hypothetical protein MOBT1_001808 [Malassezia obtusa]